MEERKKKMREKKQKKEFKYADDSDVIRGKDGVVEEENWVKIS